jgi:alpha-methylacyl-CoA racemase
MGPLEGLRIVELEAIGPVPMAAMLLADLGADVIRVDRRTATGDVLRTLMGRNRRSIAVDLKDPDGVRAVLGLVDRADVVLEGMRPGVAERLGLGPDVCRARHPGLVYARMTGWGQDGPYAGQAGHDLNYIAVAGALGAIGDPDRPPPPPLNLVGDFGGGALYLVVGVLAALHERSRSGQGQVVDAAMVDGAASLTTMFHELSALGLWGADRGANLLDGGAPFYATYRTAEGGHVAVAALEPQFFAELVRLLDLDPAEVGHQHDRLRWPGLHDRLTAVFAARTLVEWESHFAGSDACVFPVRPMTAAPDDPHLAARGTFVDVGGVRQPAPAPRLSRTPSAHPTPAPTPGAHTDAILTELGYSASEIAHLRTTGAVGGPVG